MRRRHVVLAAAAATAIVLGPGVSTSDAATCPAPNSESAAVWGVTAPNGSTVYTSGEPGSSTGTSGYIGIAGSTGYLEAGGDASTQSGYIEGSTDNGAVTGQLAMGSSGPSICLNGTNAP